MTINVSNLEKYLYKKMLSNISKDELLKISKTIKSLNLPNINYINSYYQDNSTGKLFYNSYFNQLQFGKRLNSAHGISKLWAWGPGNYGQLANNSQNNQNTPEYSTINEFNWNVVRASIGENSILAVKSDNTLWAWGRNSSGRLGDGTVTDRSSPVSLIAPANSWTWGNISASSYQTTAIKSDGTIWAWGGNWVGQLGDGTVTDRSSPVSLIAPANSWTWQQVAGGYCTSAIRSDNTLWAWGKNNYGQLGDGTTDFTSSPVSLIAPANSWTWQQVSGGYGHTVAIKSDNTIWAWGSSWSGQLGEGFTVSRSSPVSLIAPANSWTWKQVSCGYYYTTAIRSDNTLWAWGINQYGQLGDGTKINRSSPVSLIAPANSWTWSQVSSGQYFTMGIQTDGTLWLWGALPLENKSSPTSFPAMLSWKSVSAGKDAFFGIEKI